MVHNSHHHQSCNQVCWSHHCNTHLQLMDLQHCAHQHQTGDTYIVNIDFLQHMVHSNLHHQNCILGCLFHHYRTRLRSNVHLDKLEFKKDTAFVCYRENSFLSFYLPKSCFGPDHNKLDLPKKIFICP